MTIQTLFDAWQATEIDPSVNPSATAAEIQAAEEKIGVTLPQPLREVYLLFNGGWTWELDFFPLAPTPDEDLAVINANEKYIEWEWRIPQEIRLFAHNGGEEAYGIWLPETGNPIYNHPIIEVGELSGEGCMGGRRDEPVVILARLECVPISNDRKRRIVESRVRGG